MPLTHLHLPETQVMSSTERFIARAVARPMREWVIGCSFACAAIFVADVATPPGYLHALLYMLVILSAGFTGNVSLITGVTAGSILLGLAGAVLPAIPEPHFIMNRLTTLVALLVTGLAVRIATHQYAMLYRRERELHTVTAALKDAQDLLVIGGKLARFGSWQLDPETRELTLTDELKAMLRLAPDGVLKADELLGRFCSADAERVVGLVAHALRTGEGFDTEFEVNTRSGDIAWLRAIGEVAIDHRTGRKVLQGALRDVTSRKRSDAATAAQQEQLQLLQTAINRVDDMVLITEVGQDDSDWHLVYVNDAFERLTGYSREELMGQPKQILHGPRTQQKTLDRIRAALDARQPVRAELIYYTKAGREYWVELEIMPLVRADGEVTHRVTIERDVTARKRQEESDRQQAQLTSLSERLGEIGGWIASPATNKVIWSQGVRRVLDWEQAEEPPLDKIFDFYDPEYRGRAEEAVRACIEDGIAFNLEVQGHTALGRPIWARVAGTPEYDENGDVVQVVGVLQDITHSKAMEMARAAQEQMLAERTAQLEEAQRIGNMGSWSYAFDTDRLTWTQQLYTMFGIAPEDFTHDSEGFLKLVHPEDQPKIKALRQLIREDPQRHTTNFRLLRPDGEVRHVQQISEPVGPGDGVNFTGTMLDITRLVKDELALRESEERFRMVADVSADIIWDWDVTSGSIWWTDREPARFGYNMEEGTVSIDRWAGTIHQEDRAAVTESLTAAMSGSGVEWAGAYRVLKADGGTAHVNILARLVRDADGQVVRVVGSIVDVTDQRMLEAKLRTAQKLEAVGQLTGGIAHDFNNLLTVILGNSELLEDALASQPRLQALATMSRGAAERGSELTSRLLSFARRQPLDPQVVDIAALVSEIEPLLHRTIGTDIEIVTHFVPELGKVKVDPSQLENVLLNLCINARDAMPDGGRIVIEASNVSLDEAYCSLHPDVAPGEYALMSVSDVGTGMDADTLSRAFEPFFTTKAAGKGSGLGLSMVYGFAKQSRGHVRLYSEIGHGTSVQLFLPRTDAAVAALPPRPGTKVVGGQERILVVEDDVMVRAHASNLLTQLGYVVHCVGNGPEALAVLEHEAGFDLLFTDVMMPGGMNGRQLAEAARALRPQLPVLYTSGYAENAIVHNGHLDSGLQFLQKPYRKAELATKVRQALAAG
ncbi:PAS domain S-box-containing protein [Polymorphobacter multimanifer]|uniref:histidine kinase n=1 Tax=Polymorphobacter multimanifer TaxID=1070431 RepID=A0A841L5H7_9SPHN|nr:PAS domain-containing protein [Polymorphobacter multimanifer]MBB6226741.1 PAS domain S-box-containing protein [Polymorphobacter multimanifer]